MFKLFRKKKGNNDKVKQKEHHTSKKSKPRPKDLVKFYCECHELNIKNLIHGETD